MSRALSAAWDKSLFLRKIIPEDSDLVTDRTCRADLDACAAETTVSFGKRFSIYDYTHSSVNFSEFKSLYSSEFTAGAHAPSAEDAAVHFVQHKRIGFICVYTKLKFP